MSRVYIIFLFLSVILAGCRYESGYDCTQDERDFAEECGIRDAGIVVNSDAGSMEHENAILVIRAREDKLRMAGYESAADAYADAAERTMRNEGIIP